MNLKVLLHIKKKKKKRQIKNFKVYNLAET